MHVGGTHGSGNVSSAVDMRGMRGVGRVCEMCMSLGGVEGERCKWMRGLGLGLPIL